MDRQPEHKCLHCHRYVMYSNDKAEWVHVVVRNGNVMWGAAHCNTTATPIPSTQQKVTWQ